MTNEELIRKYYAGWEKKDWNTVEGLLASSFTFTSANGDDHIDLPVFRAKCWQGQVEFVERFGLECTALVDDQAFVKYLCRTTRGVSFQNVEHLASQAARSTRSSATSAAKMATHR
jgi:hypothetical protein